MPIWWLNNDVETVVIPILTTIIWVTFLTDSRSIPMQFQWETEIEKPQIFFTTKYTICLPYRL